jgi:hypothetical protein
MGSGPQATGGNRGAILSGTPTASETPSGSLTAAAVNSTEPAQEKGDSDRRDKHEIEQESEGQPEDEDEEEDKEEDWINYLSIFAVNLSCLWQGLNQLFYRFLE